MAVSASLGIKTLLSLNISLYHVTKLILIKLDKYKTIGEVSRDGKKYTHKSRKDNNRQDTSLHGFS